MIGTYNGVVRAWAIKRKAEGDRWDKDLIKNMKGTPAKPDPSGNGVEIPTRISLPKTEGDEVSTEWRKPRQEEKPR